MVDKHVSIRAGIEGGAAISFFFNAIILSILLFLPKNGVAQEAAPGENPTPSFEDDSASQDSSVEQATQSMYPKESPVILKEIEGKNSKEGIEDAFSKDQGDRFQPQNNKGAEFTTVK